MNSTIRLTTIISLFVLITACGDSNSPDTTTSAQSSIENQPPSNPTAPDPDPIVDPTPEPPELKSVTLSWNTPTSRVDGSPLSLSEIGGYEVYYFREGTPQEEGETIVVAGSNAREVATPRLAAGTYHFAIASYDTYGLHSEISSYITATIQ